MAMYDEKMVLCASSAYEQKYYFNEDFASLPDQIKDELKIMCVLFTEEVGGILTLRFAEDGTLMLETSALIVIAPSSPEPANIVYGYTGFSLSCAYTNVHGSRPADIAAASITATNLVTNFLKLFFIHFLPYKIYYTPHPIDNYTL